MARRAFGGIGQDRADARGPRAQPLRFGAHREILEINSVEIQPVQFWLHHDAVNFQFVLSGKKCLQRAARRDLLGDLDEIRVRARDRLPHFERQQRHQNFDANFLVLDIDEGVGRRVAGNAHVLLPFFLLARFVLRVVGRRRPRQFHSNRTRSSTTFSSPGMRTAGSGGSPSRVTTKSTMAGIMIESPPKWC